ncbi:DUF2937 family protein [Mesorhizobium sp. B1-1-8]|uniref:DUF2937 family protein n=1 Tax=Mesorhizobium sp. B1-1-8 TaxID=2589976 RepID=UPI0011281D79|nr:DUF2937 family protein [Mesorhizobium sp. B1-1-8]UCI09273.1 DUF2937 family protein [Mesorhizobium sp. B1-1-8]
MAMLKENLIYAMALALGISASQMPEFAQQYRQRLGGAVEELGHVVSEFDRDAAGAGLSRAQALDLHQQATEPLFKARGRSMSAAIARYENLVEQQKDFAERSPLLQPLVLGYSDRAVFAGAWQDFRPAVPITSAGLLWAAFGFFFGVGAMYMLAALLRWIWRAGMLALRRSNLISARRR